MLCRHLSAHKLSATEEQPSQRERGTELCEREERGMKEEKTGMRQGGREWVMRRERKRYEGTREMKRRKGDEV